MPILGELRVEGQQSKAMEAGLVGVEGMTGAQGTAGQGGAGQACKAGQRKPFGFNLGGPGAAVWVAVSVWRAGGSGEARPEALAIVG